MATDPQDPPRHAGQVVRRVLLRRNIAIDAETAQLVADAVQAALQTVHPPGRHAEARAGPLPTRRSRTWWMAVRRRRHMRRRSGGTCTGAA